ncbi:redoxin domain-containing protein [Spongiactinospora sp. TRM90649]|uniref:redoxin domain-containing protein n=1 Tax=Spongiactinospora sp. TRM90649 TaxID=3031114 RepID=UPI003211A057
MDLLGGWETISGARGRTAQACGFRDHHDELREAGAARVYGMSSQGRGYQRELAARLRLPFTMLSDPGFAVRDALNTPDGGPVAARRPRKGAKVTRRC